MNCAEIHSSLQHNPLPLKILLNRINCGKHLMPKDRERDGEGNRLLPLNAAILLFWILRLYLGYRLLRKSFIPNIPNLTFNSTFLLDMFVVKCLMHKNRSWVGNIWSRYFQLRWKRARKKMRNKVHTICWKQKSWTKMNKSKNA